MAYLKAEVDKVLQATGARQVVLVGNSREQHHHNLLITAAATKP